jgi:hypothetical protein
MVTWNFVVSDLSLTFKIFNTNFTENQAPNQAGCYGRYMAALVAEKCKQNFSRKTWKKVIG